MNHELWILPLLIVAGIATALVFGSVILRLACPVCSVHRPSTSLALGITLASALLTGGLGFLLSVFVYDFAPGSDDPEGPMIPKAVTLSALLPINLLVSAGIYHRTLATSLRRGMRLWLMQLGLVLCFALLTGLVVFVFLVVDELGQIKPPTEPNPPPAVIRTLE